MAIIGFLLDDKNQVVPLVGQRDVPKKKATEIRFILFLDFSYENYKYYKDIKAGKMTINNNLIRTLSLYHQFEFKREDQRR